MKYDAGILSDEEFVGNTYTNGDLSHLQGVQYRLGDVALDVYGKKIDPNYMRPLFVKKKSFGLYNSIMERHVKDIRVGQRNKPSATANEAAAQRMQQEVLDLSI